MPTDPTRGLSWWLARLFAIDFASFVLASMYFGGDALSGRIDGDRFYLGEHGRFAEVSEAVFDFSRFRGSRVLVLFVLALIAAVRQRGGVRFRFTDAERAKPALFVVAVVGFLLASNLVMGLLDLHYRFHGLP